MKKVKLVVTALLFAMVATGTAEAQTITEARGRSSRDEYHRTFQVSFFPPLSTNGIHAGRYTNDVSFNILAGVSRSERAFTFGGLANIIKEDARGVQFAGLVNYIGGEGRGLQFGGLANIGIGDQTGLQFGGLVNTSGDLVGGQFGGIYNGAGNVKGFQYSGLANVAKDVAGFQFGGLVNVAKDLDGFQFGGLVNVAKRVRGVQFAGLVNVAEHSDYPIGIVNIIKDGEKSIGLGYNDIGTMSVNFRSGGRVLYGILGVGYNHKVADREDALTLTAGYGAHINIAKWFRINNEITFESIDAIFNDKREHPDTSTLRMSYALLPAFRLWNFELFGGPSINFLRTDDPGMYDLFSKNDLWRQLRLSGIRKQVYIGWQAGLQYIF